MNQQQRQASILELVGRQGYASIEQLTEHFAVTPQTIRRDLNQLSSEGRIRRVHGGAGLESSTVNTAYSTRKTLNLEAKQRIAALLARQIPDHASLFINIGTSNEVIAEALLHHHGLEVITNNLNVAAILQHKEDFNVIIAGGRYAPGMAASSARPPSTSSISSRSTTALSASVASTKTAHCSSSTIRKSESPRPSSTIPVRSSWPPITPSFSAIPWYARQPRPTRRTVHRSRAPGEHQAAIDAARRDTLPG